MAACTKAVRRQPPPSNSCARATAPSSSATRPYLLRTWHSTTRPSKLQLDDDIKWTGLEILGSTGGSAFHSEGTVEFRANYVLAGHLTSQHENSRFLREDGAWVYVEALTAGGATGR